MKGSNNQDFRSIPRLWTDVAGWRALDMGCGRGLYALELVRRGAVVVGCDMNLASLREARRLDRGGRCLWVCSDAANLPFKRGVFDLVVSVEVLTHIAPDTRRSVFRETRRILRMGGLAFYTLHNALRLSLARWLRLRRAALVYYTVNLNVWPTVPSEAQAMLRDGGMTPRTLVRYLNYHSRFDYEFFVAHPLLSRMVITIEELLSRLPLFRCLGITFLQVAEKTSENPELDFDAFAGGKH